LVILVLPFRTNCEIVGIIYNTIYNYLIVCLFSYLISNQQQLATIFLRVGCKSTTFICNTQYFFLSKTPSPLLKISRYSTSQFQKNTDYQIYTIYPPSEIAVLQPLTFFLFCYKYNKIIYIFLLKE